MSAPLVVTLPLRLHSAANLREHWTRKASRTETQRRVARLATRAALAGPVAWPVVVSITRIAPRPLDKHDNLGSAAKAIVDGIADALGLASDSDPRVSWSYAQRRGAVREYAVEIRITSAG